MGMSVPSVGRWLDILEATAQILIVPPFFEDFGKRLIKAPKVYLADSGLTCHLLGIATEAELDKSPFLGVLFEGFLAAEIVKGQITAGRRRELYYFRNQQGLEVDLVVPARDGGVRLAEAQASATVTPGMAEPMLGSHAPNRRPASDGKTISESPSVYASDIIHACEHEMAMTLSDVMRRRTQLALSRNGSAETACRAARLMAPLLHWNADEERAQVERYLKECRQSVA